MKRIGLSLLLIAIGALISGCSGSSKTVVLPGPIETVAAGYPFALQIKNQVAPEANLTQVMVYLDRQGERFEVRQLMYGFASPKGDGRLLAIAVDNTTHEAGLALDYQHARGDVPLRPASADAPLDISSIKRGIVQVLEIARTNGLNEFCALAPPKNGIVTLDLVQAKTEPAWNLIGDGWDEKGPIADLNIVVDDKTGAITKRSLGKAKGRP